MSGITWAVLSGVGFGFFQIANRRAGRALGVYHGTFILLAVSAGMLIGLSLLTEDLQQLRQATPQSFVYFAIAGLIHFFIGWTLFSASQKRIGAARTSALLGATPLFATLIGALFFGEFLDPVRLAAVLLVVAGVYVVATA